MDYMYMYIVYQVAISGSNETYTGSSLDDVMLVFNETVTQTFISDAVLDPSQAVEQGFHVYYQPGSSGKKLL